MDRVIAFRIIQNGPFLYNLLRNYEKIFLQKKSKCRQYIIKNKIDNKLINPESYVLHLRIRS